MCTSMRGKSLHPRKNSMVTNPLVSVPPPIPYLGKCCYNLLAAITLQGDEVSHLFPRNNFRKNERKGEQVWGYREGFVRRESSAKEKCWLLYSLTLCNPKCAISIPPIPKCALFVHNKHRLPESHHSVHFPSQEARGIREKVVSDRSRKTHFQQQRPRQEWKDGETKILTGTAKRRGIFKEIHQREYVPL